jgi:hypothetical protein
LFLKCLLSYFTLLKIFSIHVALFCNCCNLDCFPLGNKFEHSSSDHGL